MKILDKTTLIRTYRNYSLRETTPDLLRTMYVARKGNMKRLEQKYGKEIVDAQIYTNHIKEQNGDTWEVTEDGLDMIETFYKKQNQCKTLKKTIFDVLTKPFK